MESDLFAHDDNVIGAAALLITDRIREAVQPPAGTGGHSMTALTTLYGWADGQHIDSLAAGMGLSHSRAVRVVDALTASNLAERRKDPDDARRAQIHLTPAGQAAARAFLAARQAALLELLIVVSPEQRRSLADACELLLQAASTPRTAGVICRMCDTEACGHHSGQCPSTNGALAHEHTQT